MPYNLPRSSGITYLIILSLLGLVLVGMVMVYPPREREINLWRKPLIGTVFAAICVFGILAVFYPKSCSRIFDYEKKETRPRYLALHKSSSTLKGHHPDCKNYAAHVFQIKGKVFCAACTGLFLGGFFAFIGSLLYFSNNWLIEEYSFLMVCVGALGVSFGLFQFRFKSLVRLFLNFFFVLGALLILIGVDNHVHSLRIDMFLIALIVFWLFTRISLSQWDHERICSNCEVTACDLVVYRKKE